MSMQTDTEGLEWLVINDFTPGIEQRLHSGSISGASPARHGAARADNTYRCIGLPRGGLAPLPKRDYTLTHPSPPSSADFAYLTAMRILGPAADHRHNQSIVGANGYHPPFYARDLDLRQFQLLLGFSWLRSSDNVKRARIQRVPLHRSTTPVDLHSFTAAGTSGSTDIREVVYSGVGRAAITGGADYPIYQTCMFGFNTSENVEDAAFAFPYPEGFRVCWPDTTAAGSVQTNTAGVLDANGDEAGMIVAHQNRWLEAANNKMEAGPRGDGGMDLGYAAEDIGYTEPNDTGNFSSIPTVIGNEDPYGYGVMASLSASDLLVIKNQGGAYLVQGDFASPTVRHMPGVVSTGGIQCYGAMTPVGFVYGVNYGGVYAWTGGDGSDKISAALEDDFWICSDADPVRLFQGQFYVWKDWVLTPNNWLFDTVTKSWWRLEDPSVRQFWLWAADPVTNYLYGGVVKFNNNAATDEYVHGWNPSSYASDYSWQSQPFPVSLLRQTVVREIHLVTQGTGTVAITLSGSGNPDVTVTFTIPADYSDQPILLRQRLNWEGSNLSVRIVAAHTSTGPAPIVNAVRLGHREGPMVPETGVLS